MNKLKYLILCLWVVSACTEKKHELISNEYWTEEKAEKHLLNRQDSTTWDWDMYNNDLQHLNFHTDMPITNGIFPNPDYDLIGKGSFKGVGNFGFPGGEGLEKKVGNKTLLYNSFFAGRSEITGPFTGDKEDGVFFQIIVLTDWIDTVNYSHLSSEVISRNHPDYIGQGFYQTQKQQIDYAAFVTADQNAYAIVNMRLFDLKKGKTILIAPQKDQTLRSLQIKSPPMSSKELDTYTDQLLEQKKIIQFFTAPGNI